VVSTTIAFSTKKTHRGAVGHKNLQLTSCYNFLNPAGASFRSLSTGAA
jgi:hypothetical protein